MARINYRELARMYRGVGPKKGSQLLRESLDKGLIAPRDFSLREAAEALICDRNGEPCGREYVRSLDPGGGGFHLMEATGAIQTGDFSNITGQIIYSTVLESYSMPEFVGDKLCTVIPTKFDGEKIPGVSEIGDEAETIDENQPYPVMGVQEDWIETPQTTKRGFIVPVTKEAIFFDRTNVVLTRAANVGTWLAVNREKRIIDIATGQTNNWKWRGTAYNTYAASGGHGVVNQIADVLADYSDIEAAELKLAAITDPNTGEPVAPNATTLIVPPALKHTAFRILNSTQIESNANPTGNTRTMTTIHANPISGLYDLVASAWVKARTSSDTKWFFGNPKRAFAYMENWPITVVQAPANSEAEFTQDQVARYKVSERGVAAVIDPRQMIYSTGAG